MLMRSEQGDSRFDAAIDAAASALTSADPSPALRAGVRDRIGKRRTAWWLVPASVLAVVVVVALVGRILPGPATQGGPDKARPTDIADLRPALDRVSPPPETVGRTLSGPAAQGGPDKARPPRMRRLPPTFEPAPEDLEPLIPPLMIPPLETQQIAVDARSGVMPIEIEPLRIEPLQGE